MAHIVIFGDAHVRKEYENGYVETQKYPHEIHRIDIEYGPGFAEYLPDPLNEIFGNSSAWLEYNGVSGKYYIYTEYEIIGEDVITDEYVNRLTNYTTGQWSDGIGEGYVQWPVHTNVDDKGYFEVYASMWHRNQKVGYYFK